MYMYMSLIQLHGCICTPFCPKHAVLICLHMLRSSIAIFGSIIVGHLLNAIEM